MKSNRDVECDNEDKQVKIKAQKNKETKTEQVSTRSKPKRNHRLSFRNEREEAQREDITKTNVYE